MDEKVTKRKSQAAVLREQIERLLEDVIDDSNIRRYIFGKDDFEDLQDLLYEYNRYPEFMKNTLSLAFYFSYACYRYDMDYGNQDAESMTKHNSKRVIKSLKDAFVRYPVTQDLIQFVLTDIQFDLAQRDGEMRDVLGDLSNRDMSRFSFNPYFKQIAEYDKAPSRFEYDVEEVLRQLKELLETLTFLHEYELQQKSDDMFCFVRKHHSSCAFPRLPLNHIFFQSPKYYGGIYHLISMETRPQGPDGAGAPPAVTLRYLSFSNNILTFALPAEETEDDDSHLTGQRSYEVYMEVTGWEMALKTKVIAADKDTIGIAQIHTVNYKYIKNLALAISDAISANAGSKEALEECFSGEHSDIFQQSGGKSQQGLESADASRDWDAIVIMLLIEASPSDVLKNLMLRVPQTFYDIVSNLYKRTDLPFFNAKQSALDAEVQRIYKTKLIVGEAGGYGKIDTPKPTGKLLAQARAMLIISQLSALQESEQDDSLIYTGNLRSNISLLQNVCNNGEKEKQIRYACIILSETLKHLLCFYSGLYQYGVKKAEYDGDTYNKCLSDAKIKEVLESLETGFFAAAKAKAEELAKADYEAGSPRDTLKLFKVFIDFCSAPKNNGHKAQTGSFAAPKNDGFKPKSEYLYAAVGKYEIMDRHMLERLYTRLENASDDPYSHADLWLSTTLDILEYFKTGSFSNTPVDHNLFNAIYPLTAVFNHRTQNHDGHETINFSLNIDIDNDNKPEHQQDINVLSEFTYARSEVYYCLPNVIRSNYKWWIDPVLINFKKFNDIFDNIGKEKN